MEVARILSTSVYSRMNVTRINPTDAQVLQAPVLSVLLQRTNALHLQEKVVEVPSLYVQMEIVALNVLEVKTTR